MFSFKGCVPCKALYPAVRKVEERFTPKGLSVLGVMVDRTVDTVQEAIDAGDITWRCVWDGPSGPITKTYNVKGYPTLFLIDGNGRIKATSIDLRHEDSLVASVETLFDDQVRK
jgi:thiol-disulfide isomerase/thioredoxin